MCRCQLDVHNILLIKIIPSYLTDDGSILEISTICYVENGENINAYFKDDGILIRKITYLRILFVRNLNQKSICLLSSF